MAIQITTYSGLKIAFLDWLGRETNTVLDARFDDFLLNVERRMWYGHATEDVGNPLRSDPLRIVEMETVDLAFAMADTVSADSDGVRLTALDDVRVVEDFDADAIVAGSGLVAQPSDFLELISAYNDTLDMPLQIVAQRIIDAYGNRAVGGTKLIAVSGENFRFWDAPTSGTATLRYYRKLTTPTEAGAVNTILTRYPDMYLNGLLVEAAAYTQDVDAAISYLRLYNASAQGLNARTQRITASANPVMRLRGGMMP